jgi:ribonuclease P protein component
VVVHTSGGTLKRFSFPKTNRLVSNKQFKAVLARNLCARNDLLTLFVAENNCGHLRLGVSVGKSIGGAVVRNRLKRLLREVFRQNQHRICANCDYLLMISPKWSKKLSDRTRPAQAAKQLTLEQLNAAFLELVNETTGRLGPKNEKQ